MIGDFNNILSNAEKWGCNDHLNRRISGFRNAVIDDSLTNIKLEGYPYNRSKGLQTDKTVEECLDMAMARTEWLQIFPNHKFITIATMLYCK